MSKRRIVTPLFAVAVSIGIVHPTYAATGGGWENRTPAGGQPSPPAARDGVMAYDEARNHMTLFTGGQTWTWDGRAWAEQHPDVSPPARAEASMAYDAQRRRVVLFGGRVTLDPVGPKLRVLADTWTWDGKTWSEEHPSSSPPARASGTALYVERLRKVVLFGVIRFGDQSAKPELFRDTWAWDGSNWSKIEAAGGPDFTAGAWSYDRARQEAMLFGGSGRTCACTSDQTWTWNGRDWKQRRAKVKPQARIAASMAYNLGTGTSLLFGGFAGSNYLSDTWTWNGTHWSPQPGASPPARAGAPTAYDASRQEVVMFGSSAFLGDLLGGVYPNALNDTWAWKPTPTSSRVERSAEAETDPGTSVMRPAVLLPFTAFMIALSAFVWWRMIRGGGKSS